MILVAHGGQRGVEPKESGPLLGGADFASCASAHCTDGPTETWNLARVADGDVGGSKSEFRGGRRETSNYTIFRHVLRPTQHKWRFAPVR